MRRPLRLITVAGTIGTASFATPALAASPVIAADGAKTWLVMLGAAAAGLGLFLLFVILFGGGRSHRESEIAGRLGTYGGRERGGSGVFGRFRILRRAASRAEAAVESRGQTRMIESALEQANIPITAGEAVIGALGVAMVAAVVFGALLQSLIWAVAAGAAVLIASFLYVNSVAARHRKRFDAQLADTLNLLATSLRAGYSVLQAIEAAAHEAPEPTRREFGRAMTEIRLGRPMIDALGDIAVRMESKDFEWAVLAIAIQREVGGNLAEVLQSTAETILHRNRFRREVKALTAEGRISAWIMGLMPIVVFAAIIVVNPDYVRPLYTTTVGWIMVGGAVLLMAAGVVWMMKIVNIDV